MTRLRPRAIRPELSAPVGCLVIVAVVIGYALMLCVSVLTSAILVDVLWHLGRWLLGW